MNSLSRTERSLLFALMAAASMPLLLACGSDGGPGRAFAGTIDTLPSGRVVVSNPAEGLWEDGEAWQVTEEIRIGRLDGDGPDIFGSIRLLEVDDAGRFYVFERQTQELRVFDQSGRHVRTVGRKGGGPGEFTQVLGMDWSADGNLWLVDPNNNRISVIDTAGAYIDSHRMIGGYSYSPWPGGFDDQGRFINYGVNPNAEFGSRLLLVRYDENMEPADTIHVPVWTGEENFLEIRTENSMIRASVPFASGLTWQFVRRTPYIWFAHTGDYHLFQRTFAGDTLRIVSRAFDPQPVTGEDIDSAIVRLEWFTGQGGKIDRSKFPDNKPAMQNFYVDDVGRLFVVPVTTDEQSYRVLDVFDELGRYLGRVNLPFRLYGSPRPIFRRGKLWAVTRDDLDVPYVIRADLGIPDTEERGRARQLVGGG